MLRLERCLMRTKAYSVAYHYSTKKKILVLSTIIYVCTSTHIDKSRSSQKQNVTDLWLCFQNLFSHLVWQIGYTGGLSQWALIFTLCWAVTIFFKKQAVTIYSNVAYNHICSGDHQWRIVDTAKSRISGQDIVLVLHRQKNITGQVKHPMKAGMLFFCFGTCPGFVKIDDAA